MRVSVPVPVLARAPSPLTTPPRVSALPLVSTVRVPAPVMATALATVRLFVPDLSVVSAAIASAPVPSAVLVPTWMVPASRVVPPV